VETGNNSSNAEVKMVDFLGDFDHYQHIDADHYQIDLHHLITEHAMQIIGINEVRDFAEFLEDMGVDISHLSAHQISTFHQSIDEILNYQDSVNVDKSTVFPRNSHPSYSLDLDHDTPEWNSKLDYSQGDHVLVSQHGVQYKVTITQTPAYRSGEYHYHVETADQYFIADVTKDQIIGIDPHA
jgi:hypothetical protein